MERNKIGHSENKVQWPKSNSPSSQKSHSDKIMKNSNTVNILVMRRSGTPKGNKIDLTIGQSLFRCGERITRDLTVSHYSAVKWHAVRSQLLN